MTIDLNVTRRILALGSQDSTTGWYATDRSSTSTIEMTILRRGQTLIGSPIGLYARHDYTGFTDDPIAEGDVILDQNTNDYMVNLVTAHWIGDSFYCYECELAYNPQYADRPATSGTWWLETGLNLDPRYRHKKLLDDNLTAANMKEDDNATNASYITTMGMCDYPITKVFTGKGVDLVFCIESATSTPLKSHDKTIFEYEHSVPISTWAINKSGITATRLLRAAEHEIERIVETYPTGSVRTIGREEPNEGYVANIGVYSKKYTMEYTIGASG